MDEIILKLIIEGLDIYGINPEAKESFKRMIKNYGDLKYNEGFLAGEVKSLTQPPKNLINGKG